MIARKLGKRPARRDSRTLMLAAYTSRIKKDPPVWKDWSPPVLGRLGPMGNNDISDCTIAAIAHMVQVWTAAELGREHQVIVPDADVIEVYRKVCGYDPARPETDAGGIMLDVLKWWRQNSVGGHSIEAFCGVNPNNKIDIKDAIWLFGGCYMGFNLPLTAEDQHDAWTTPSVGMLGRGAPGSWGGHAINATTFNSRGIAFVTWGKIQFATWDFVENYCDECYAVLSKDWVGGLNAASPSGFDFQELRDDLAALNLRGVSG